MDRLKFQYTGAPGHGHANVDKLLQAIKARNACEVKSLLSRPLDVNILDNKKKSLLFYAITSNHADIIDAVIKKGADVNLCSYAAYHRDNKLCSSVEPPVVTAARTGSYYGLKLLAEAGANLDAQGELQVKNHAKCKDRCALHFACEDCRDDMVELLLAHNAEVNLADKGEETALHKAVRCGRNCAKQCQIVQWLCEHGADVDHIDKILTTPLYLATFYGCIRKMEILLLYGADTNRACRLENTYGTPLHITAAKDQVKMAQLLLRHGAKLNVANAAECTPLHLNVNLMIKSSVAQHLVYHGASVSCVDKQGRTLLESCFRNMRLDCEHLCKLVVYSGCNLNKENWLKAPHDDDDDTEGRVYVPSGRMRELYDWLGDQQSNPLSLFDQARIAIRKHLSGLQEGASIVSSIEELPLAPSHKDLVLLKDWVDLNQSPSNTRVFGKLL